MEKRLVLFVGDVDDSLSQRAKAYRNDAFLVDKSNFKKILNDDRSNIVAYTSLADLPKIEEHRNVFYDLLSRADLIYYCPPTKWSDHVDEFTLWSTKQTTEYFLYEINKKNKNVYGLELPDWKDNRYVSLVDHRKVESPQLWIAGCSIPHGVGIDAHERFGSILADRLSLPVSYLTLPGSSIPWSSDQILRSDIKSDDVLVWAITSEYRYCVWMDKKLEHFLPFKFQSSEDQKIVDNLENMMYNAVTSIYRVINICQKLDVKLILLPVLSSETARLLLHNCPNWYSPEYRLGLLDLGTDKIHPGPKQHAEWADFCYNIIIGNKK